MPKVLTWRKAIEKVLREAPAAIHYSDLTDAIIEQSLRTSFGATPAASVSAHLTTAIKREGGECPFLKVGRGLYIWKAKAGITIAQPTIQDDEDDDTEDQYDVISSFGMFWRGGRRMEFNPQDTRDAADWCGSCRFF